MQTFQCVSRGSKFRLRNTRLRNFTPLFRLCNFASLHSLWVLEFSCYRPRQFPPRYKFLSWIIFTVLRTEYALVKRTNKIERNSKREKESHNSQGGFSFNCLVQNLLQLLHFVSSLLLETIDFRLCYLQIIAALGWALLFWFRSQTLTFSIFDNRLCCRCQTAIFPKLTIPRFDKCR